MRETAPGVELDSKLVGAFPLVNHILKRLHFEQILRKHLHIHRFDILHHQVNLSGEFSTVQKPNDMRMVEPG